MKSKQEKYLGQIISTDGTNVKNIIFRAGKGAGMSRLIEKVLNHVPGGKFHFETAVIFRNAYLISTMLSCSEVWYDLTEWDVRKLEQTDETFLRHILNCSSQVTSEVLSLELGLLPARFIIKIRRLTYLHQIMNQRNKNSLIFQFLMAQMNEPKKNYWGTQVKKDLDKINMDINIIEQISTKKFKEIVREKKLQKFYLNI